MLKCAKSHFVSCVIISLQPGGESWIDKILWHSECVCQWVGEVFMQNTVLEKKQEHRKRRQMRSNERGVERNMSAHWERWEDVEAVNCRIGRGECFRCTSSHNRITLRCVSDHLIHCYNFMRIISIDLRRPLEQLVQLSNESFTLVTATRTSRVLWKIASGA